MCAFVINRNNLTISCRSHGKQPIRFFHYSKLLAHGLTNVALSHLPLPLRQDEYGKKKNMLSVTRQNSAT